MSAPNANGNGNAPMSRTGKALWLTAIIGLLGAAAFAAYVLLTPGSDVVHSQATSPYSYFQGLSPAQLQTLQVKLSYVGPSNKPAWTAGLGLTDISKFVPFEKADLIYGGDEFVVETCQASTDELSALISGAGEMPDVAGAAYALLPFLSFMLVQSDQSGDNGFEAVLDEAASGDLLNKVIQALDTSNAACYRLILTFSSQLGVGPIEAVGDVNCDGRVDSTDALTVLRYRAALKLIDSCINIAGDVDCDTDIGSVDALDILRFTALLGYTKPADCTAIGQPAPRP
jgi:hypothetical protein